MGVNDITPGRVGTPASRDDPEAAIESLIIPTEDAPMAASPTRILSFGFSIILES